MKMCRHAEEIVKVFLAFLLLLLTCVENAKCEKIAAKLLSIVAIRFHGNVRYKKAVLGPLQRYFYFQFICYCSMRLFTFPRELPARTT